MAKIALLFALSSWPGDALIATDSTAALMSNLTRAPPPPASSALIIPYRASLVPLRARLFETWIPARHDTASESLLADLSAIADELANRGAQQALPDTTPWTQLYSGRVLATHQGQLILGPRRASEAIAHHHQELEYARHYPTPQSGWSTTDLVAALETAVIPPRAVHILMLHRLLSVQRRPPGYGGVVCPYYHLAHADITTHLLRHCPHFFLHHLVAAWRFLRHPLVLPLLVTDMETSHLGQGVSVSTPQLHVGLRSGLLGALPLPSVPAPSRLILSQTGAWQVDSPDPRRPPLLAPQRAVVASDHHEVMAQPAPSLQHALATAPDLWRPLLVPIPDLVHVLHDTTTLGLRDSILLGWLLRRCRAWQLYTASVPCIPLPPCPLPSLPSARVVCSLGSTHQALHQLVSRVPDHGHLVVLARAVDVQRLQSHLQEPLMLHPVTPGVMVGRAVGAPLNLQDWLHET